MSGASETGSFPPPSLFGIRSSGSKTDTRKKGVNTKMWNENVDIYDRRTGTVDSYRQASVASSQHLRCSKISYAILPIRDSKLTITHITNLERGEKAPERAKF